MFLSPEIYQWPFDYDERSSGPDTSFLFRGHEIWRHAALHLEGSPTDLHRVDCISALRRAINHRLKSLSGVYNFDFLPTSHAKRQLLERMQELGLVRPVMLKELLEVRNLIEHQDADPPELEACHRFVDIVWYFLKSTDELVNMPVSRIAYESDDHISHVYLSVEPSKDWTIQASGLVSESLLFTAHVSQALELVDLTTTQVRGKKGFVKFKANTKPDHQALLKVAHEYFCAAGYWHDA